MTHENPLPHWIFDVDDDDDEDNQINKDGSTIKRPSLLEELEIDPKHIYRYKPKPHSLPLVSHDSLYDRNVVWMMIGPFLKLVGRPYKRHPLYVSNSNLSKHSIDYWGPCTIVILYCLILWLGRVRDVGWIFVIWTVAAIMNHFVSRVFYHSSLMIHIALLGYSLTPILPFAAVILFVNPPVWVSSLLELTSVVWASTSAILSYATIVTISTENKPKLKLLYPTVILMELYITSLPPIMRR